MKGRVQPEEAIYEHLVHNKYFPETSYRFEGISDESGDVRIVLSQEFVESADKAMDEQAQACLGRWQEIVNEGKARAAAAAQAEAEAKAARAAAEKARAEREKTLERQERAEDSANRPGLYSKVMEHWAEPTSAYEYMLRALAGGGVKLRWNDSEHSKTHGLGAHIVGGDNLRKSWRGDTEYGPRKWMIDDKSGFWPEEYAERVCQDYYHDYDNDTDHFQEVFGDLLDICLSKPTSRAMYEAAREMHAAKDTRRYSEWELMKMQHYGVDTPEEADFADMYGMRYLEYEAESEQAEEAFAEMGHSADDYSEIMRIFVESEIEDYERSRETSVDEPRGADVGGQGGGRVLQATQPDDNAGVPEPAGEARPAGGGGAYVHADDAAQAEAVGESGRADAAAEVGAVGTTAAPVSERIAAAEAEVNTDPTEAQKEAGNYKKEHRRIDGYNISIENARGSVRRGTDADGKEWETTMQNDYGYIRGTEGVDGDHIDVFLSDTPNHGDVFVVDQVNVEGSFDEHKVMYGFPTEESARARRTSPTINRDGPVWGRLPMSAKRNSRSGLARASAKPSHLRSTRA